MGKKERRFLMKVADGFWLSKKGYNVNYASQAYKVETTENSIKVLATPYTVMNRGMTLGGPNLEITYSSTSENIIKVHIDLTEEVLTIVLVMSSMRIQVILL